METKVMDIWAKKILHAINDPDATAAARKKKYFISPAYFPMNIPSFWDGGSISFWAFVKLSTMQVAVLPSNHPVFEAGRPFTLKALPDDCILVQYGIFCGKTATAHFYTKPINSIPSDESSR